jgi:MFS family permease
MLQGMSSMGEIVGAELYLTEMVKPPKQYFIVTLIAVASIFGTVVALGTASLVTSFGFNWRMAFWIGAGVALVGSIARSSMRETPEFVNAKRKVNNKLGEVFDKDTIEENPIIKNQKKLDKKTIISLLLINCGWPACFYFSYVHCGNILKNSFGFTPEQVIHQNLVVCIIQLLGLFFVGRLSVSIHPFKILKTKWYIFFSLIIISPYLILKISDPFGLLLACESHPAVPILFKHFPIFKRYTHASLSYAMSRATMYIITSFGLVYLVKYFDNWGLVILMLPISIGFIIGVNHFQSLEESMNQNNRNKILAEEKDLNQLSIEG